MDAIAQIDDTEVITIMGRREEQIRGIAEQFGIANYTTDFDEAINTPGVDAVIIASPTQLHAQQGIAAMRAGKHVMIEIPMCDSVADAEALCEVQKKKQGWSQWLDIPVALTPAISGYITRSWLGI